MKSEAVLFTKMLSEICGGEASERGSDLTTPAITLEKLDASATNSSALECLLEMD